MIYTIGHSTRSIDEFLELCDKYEIKMIVDVRSYPGSRRYPHFNSDQMSEWLIERGIIYTAMDELGGRRGVNKEVSRDLISGWRHAAFRNYAAHMQSDEFGRGLSKLIACADRTTTAFMCSEALWWKCHRRMISDALTYRGIDVMHIMNKYTTSLHEPTAFSSYINDRVVYPAVREEVCK